MYCSKKSRASILYCSCIKLTSIVFIDLIMGSRSSGLIVAFQAVPILYHKLKREREREVIMICHRNTTILLRDYFMLAPVYFSKLFLNIRHIAGVRQNITAFLLFVFVLKYCVFTFKTPTHTDIAM